MTIDELVQNQWEWLQNEGPEADIVFSTRIRLARNVAEFPFMSRLNSEDRKNLHQKLHDALRNCPGGKDYTFLEMENLSDLDRNLLVESHLISRELADGSEMRSVMIAPDEHCSIMLLEEDHLRIQVLRGGFDLHATWEAINDLDDQIEQQLVYAWNEQLGYLTACPTNVGTGMRVSVMLHLPALVATRQFPKVYQSLQKISLTVRGLYGEGSQAFGDFYQISNQVTLGVREEATLQQVGDVVRSVINYEMRARSFLLSENADKVRQDVLQCLEILRTSETLSPEETMRCLSYVRMGINMGLIDHLPIHIVNQLLIQTQPAHLQWIYGGVTSSLDANLLRAQYLQKHLQAYGIPQ
ncbi:MAG: protein arginine kinase [Planctomycetia bacterium]|nr:protein arginine kinase [Planctomycetia bacterium]